jgi:putative flippase GtrA
MKQLIQKHEQKIRFGAVGILNTAVDFGIYTVLTYAFGYPIFGANLISTSAANTTSYFFNRSFTFSSKNERKLHEFIRFWIVTLIGLWILQPIIIFTAKYALTALHLPSFWLIIIPKAIAILVGLIWNYIWYSRFVFAHEKRKEQL